MKWASSCLCFCSAINAVLIKPIRGEWRRKSAFAQSSLSRTSTPPAPWFGSHQFLRGSSYWKCSRGCCGPGTNFHPPTDQSDRCRGNRGSSEEKQTELWLEWISIISLTSIHCTQRRKWGEKTLPASTNGKGVQVSFYEERVFSSPSEALQRDSSHNYHKRKHNKYT